MSSLNVFVKHSYNFIDIFKLKPLRQFVYDLKCCKQRIVNGYCDSDWQDLDVWFKCIMPNMLYDLRHRRIGSPTFSKEETKKLIEKYKLIGVDENDEESWHVVWNAVLDEMIFSFTESDEEMCQRKNPYEEDLMSGQDNHEDIFKKWSKEEEKLERYQSEQFEKALSMFTKYISHLWS